MYLYLCLCLYSTILTCAHLSISTPALVFSMLGVSSSFSVLSVCQGSQESGAAATHPHMLTMGG